MRATLAFNRLTIYRKRFKFKGSLLLRRNSKKKTKNKTKKKHDYMEIEGIFAIYIIFADISKIDPSF